MQKKFGGVNEMVRCQGLQGRDGRWKRYIKTFKILETFLTVQRSRVRASTARGTGLIPGWETEILHTACFGQIYIYANIYMYGKSSKGKKGSNILLRISKKKKKRFKISSQIHLGNRNIFTDLEGPLWYTVSAKIMAKIECSHSSTSAQISWECPQSAYEQ